MLPESITGSPSAGHSCPLGWHLHTGPTSCARLPSQMCQFPEAADAPPHLAVPAAATHPTPEARPVWLRCRTRRVGRYSCSQGVSYPQTPAPKSGWGEARCQEYLTRCSELLHLRDTLPHGQEATAFLTCPSAFLEALG